MIILALRTYYLLGWLCESLLDSLNLRFSSIIHVVQNLNCNYIYFIKMIKFLLHDMFYLNDMMFNLKIYYYY